MTRRALLAVVGLTSLGLASACAPDARDDAAGGRLESPILSRSALEWAMRDGVVAIPYEIENTGQLSQAVFDRTSHRIRRAMDHWETHARRPGGGQLLRFVPRQGEARWVQLQVKHNHGYCYVDLRGTGKTRVDADPECRWQTFVHELGHVLTFRHEQKRHDRPDHVVFHPERTDEDAEYTTVAGGDFLGTPYDSYSIMHYPSCMFALSRCNASTPDAWVLERRTGTRYISWWSDRTVGDILSPTDVCALRTLYDLPCSGGGTDRPDAGAVDVDMGSERDGAVVDAGPPPPAPIAVPGTIQRAGSALCLAPDGDGPLGLAPCDAQRADQRWGLSPTGALRDEGSGRCASAATLTEAADVGQGACRPDPGMAWRFGEATLVNGATGRCLGVPGADAFEGQPLVEAPCDGGPVQRFAYLPDTHELETGGFCLAAGGAPGMRLTLRSCDGGPAQRWIETNGGFAAAGWCIGVVGAHAASVACDGAPDQMWGLGGPIAANDDELCLAATDGRARLAACAEGDPDQAWVWWPRAACVSLACPEIGATCGRYDDGCGQPLDCGACPMEPAADAGPGEVEECAPPYCDAPDAGEPPPHAADGGPAPERSPAHDSGCATAGATPGPASALALLALLLLRRRRSPR